MIAYNVPDDMDRPLFGVSTRRERLLNLVLGIITTMCVMVTFISAFAIPQKLNALIAVNIYFVVCIALVCLSLLLLIHWYRQGDVDPKFRKMIYFNSITVVLLCVSANLYIHDVGGQKCNHTSS